MASFKVLLDDLGIETAPASCIGSEVRVYPAGWTRTRKYGAVGVVPVSIQSTTSGALKGAAWGVFLAGPLGAAVGSMVGGGMKVAFEIHTLEGETLCCIAGKGAYLDIKKQVETRPARPKPAKKPPRQPGDPRRVGLALGLGVAILPIPFGLLLARKGHTNRARAIAAVWAVLWVIGFNMRPVQEASPVAAPRAEAAATVAP